MEGCQADLFLSDPPYNVNIVGGGKKKMKILNDNMSDSDFDVFLKEAFTRAFEHTKEGGAFYIWHPSIAHMEFERALSKVGFLVKQQLIWVKNTFTLGRRDYQWKHEPCLYGWKDGAAHYFIDSRKETSTIEDKGIEFNKMKKEELVDMLEKIYSEKTSTTIIRENKPAKNGLHPTMKPIALMRLQIRNSTRQGEVVMDLFGGSGSTLIACEQINRKCYTMELNPRYVDVIISRYEKMTGRTAELVSRVSA